MTDADPAAKIYLTYKTRMTTESLLRRRAFFSNVMLAWYSFCMIVFSLMDLSRQFLISNFSMISAVVSMAIFAMTLFIYGQRYSERADQFRECYLKLQRLYQSKMNIAAKMNKYSDILSLYENQSDHDFNEMQFSSWLRRKELKDSKGVLTISWPTIFLVTAKRIGRIGILSTIFLIPVGFGVLWIKPAG